jgi:hypothetical protein
LTFWNNSAFGEHSERRVAQLVQKLKNEMINPKQWRLGSFLRLMCPKVNCVGPLQLGGTVTIFLSFPELFL